MAKYTFNLYVLQALLNKAQKLVDRILLDCFQVQISKNLNIT